MNVYEKAEKYEKINIENFIGELFVVFFFFLHICLQENLF